MPLQLPPQNIEAEQSLLGSLLIDPDSFPRIHDAAIAPSDFYVPAHQQIFEIMLGLRRKGQNTDLFALSTELDTLKKTEAIGGRSALAGLMDCAVSSVNVDQYAELIKGKSAKRRVLACAQKIINQAYDPSKSLDELRATATALSSIIVDATKPEGKGFRHISETLPDTFNLIEQAVENYGTPNLRTSIRTGFRDLDEKIIGIEKGNLVMVLADTGVGKSLFVQNLAINIAEKSYTVLYFTTGELNDDLVNQRFISRCSDIPIRNLRTGKLTKNDIRDDFASLTTAIEHLSFLPLHIHSKNLEGHELYEAVANYCAMNPEDNEVVVIVDYMQNVDHSKYGGVAHEQLSQITSYLKRIASEFDCPVIATSQVKQSVHMRDNKRPQLSDTDGSKQIRDKAQLILGLYRDVIYNPQTPDHSIMEVACLKNTSGESGWQIKLECLPEISSLFDYDSSSF